MDPPLLAKDQISVHDNGVVIVKSKRDASDVKTDKIDVNTISYDVNTISYRKK